METHDTIVIAWDQSGQVQFCKTFDTSKNREAMYEAFDYVKANFPNYSMSDIQHFLHTKNFKEDYV